MAYSLRLPRRRSTIEFLLLLSLVFIIFYLLILPNITNQNISPPQQINPQSPLSCSTLPGAKDTVTILKTSATELEARLPIHLAKTLLCSHNNSIIFSDYAENFQGHRIHDALASVDRSIRESHPDFELWRRLRKHGPDGLEDEELWDPEGTVGALDRWKYLPMVEAAFRKYPEKKWYVLVETGTFVFWSDLLLYLDTLDPTEPHCIGASMTSGDKTLTDPSAGIVLSHAAMEALVTLYRETKDAWTDYTLTASSGSAILAQALSEADVPFTPAWPLFNSQPLSNTNYTQSSPSSKVNPLWCLPAITFGHTNPSTIAELFKFTQSPELPQPLRHADIFTTFILPRLAIRSGRVDDWDNFSPSNSTPASSIDDCLGPCREDARCVQYSFSAGRCRFSDVPRMGESKVGMESRWLLARAKRWAEEMDELCREGVDGWGF